MKNVVHAVTVLFLLLTFSCCRGENTPASNSLVNRGNYKKYLEELERGYAYNNLAIRSNKILGDILNYINANKEKVYKGNEDRYQFDVAMIYLYKADFFRAFQLFKDYIGKRGDKIRSYYHIGNVLYLQDKETGRDVMRKSVIALIENSQYKLDTDQHRVLLGRLYDYPFQEVDALLSKEVKETEEYKFNHNGHLDAIEKTENYQRRIERRYGFEFFTGKDIQQIEENPEITDIEIDFLVKYYVKPYYTNYEKAARLADKRDRTIRRGDSDTYPIVANMMQAYLGVGRYDDAIEIYDHNKNNVSVDFRELKMTQEHINLLLSAAFAGKRNFTKSLEYLQRELAVTEVKKTWLGQDGRSSLSIIEAKGDMLYSLFNMVFVLDEFEEFKKTGLYGKMEELVDRYVGLYKHLPVFNRY